MAKLTITRAVTPGEIVDLIWGTGALSWSWWRRANLVRGGERYHLLDPNTVEAKPRDRFELAIDDPDKAEGVIVKQVTQQQICDAFVIAFEKDLVGRQAEGDAVREDGLGMLDSVAADNVLQIAVLGEVVYG